DRRRRSVQAAPAPAANASPQAGSGTATKKLSKLAGLATCLMAATASPSPPNVLPLLSSKPGTVAVNVPENRLPSSAFPVGPKSSKLAVAENCVGAVSWTFSEMRYQLLSVSAVPPGVKSALFVPGAVFLVWNSSRLFG